MARERKGTLVWRKKGWCARLTVTVDGEPVKKWFPLGTDNRAAAKRKLARLVASLAGGGTPDADAGARAETVAEYVDGWFKLREAGGMASVCDERNSFKNSVADEIGELAVTAVRPAHIRSVLDAAVERGLKRNSVVNLRALLNRIFKSLWQDEIIAENPVERVAIPTIRETTKERVILTDAEIAQYLACAEVDLELRLMSLVARVQGGMRTSDVNRWDWSMLDRVHFAECFVPRSKTGKPQRLQIPEVLRPMLRARWEARGCLESGPVFPVRRGKRAGEFRSKRGISYAAPLRRDLLRAGVVRHKCVREPMIEIDGELVPNPPVKVREACCPNMVHDPLFSETATTLPVDFHSFRRAFNTSLAEAGINVQRAMHLSAHSDEKVHMRYVMSTPEMRRIPDAAVPRLGVRLLPQKTRAVSDASSDPAFSSSHLRDLNSRPTVYEANAKTQANETTSSAAAPVMAQEREGASGSTALCRLPVSHGRPWLVVVAELGPGLVRAAVDLPVGAFDTLAGLSTAG